ETGFVEGKRVVVAAGTFGTTELLLNCKGNGMLPKLSAAIGRRFSINGNVLAGALKPGKPQQPVKTNSGPAIASMIDYGSFAIEDFADPTWAGGMFGSSSLKKLLSFLLALSGFKPRKKSGSGSERDLLMYVGVGDDGSRGRLLLNRFGQLSLNWPGGINSEPGVK